MAFSKESTVYKANSSQKLFAPAFFRPVGQDVALDDVAVPADTDAALPLGLQGGGIPGFREKAPDVLARAPHRTVREYQKFDHVAGIIVIPLHRQQIVSDERETDRLHGFPLSLMARTAQPYRAIRRALVMRLNTSVSVTSLLERSLSITPDVSAQMSRAAENRV